MRNTDSFRINGDVWSTSASSGLKNQFSTTAPFLSDDSNSYHWAGELYVKLAFLDGRFMEER
jgi:hypothetical protein